MMKDKLLSKFIFLRYLDYFANRFGNMPGNPHPYVWLHMFFSHPAGSRTYSRKFMKKDEDPQRC